MRNSFDTFSNKENWFKEDWDEEKDELNKIKKCNEKFFQNFHYTHSDAKQPKINLTYRDIIYDSRKNKLFRGRKLKFLWFSSNYECLSWVFERPALWMYFRLGRYYGEKSLFEVFRTGRLYSITNKRICLCRWNI